MLVQESNGQKSDEKMIVSYVTSLLSFPHLKQGCFSPLFVLFLFVQPFVRTHKSAYTHAHIHSLSLSLCLSLSWNKSIVTYVYFQTKRSLFIDYFCCPTNKIISRYLMEIKTLTLNWISSLYGHLQDPSLFRMPYNLLCASGCWPSFLLYGILSVTELKKRRIK